MAFKFVRPRGINPEFNLLYQSSLVDAQASGLGQPSGGFQLGLCPMTPGQYAHHYVQFYAVSDCQ